MSASERHKLVVLHQGDYETQIVGEVDRDGRTHVRLHPRTIEPRPGRLHQITSGILLIFVALAGMVLLAILLSELRSM